MLRVQFESQTIRCLCLIRLGQNVEEVWPVAGELWISRGVRPVTVSAWTYWKGSRVYSLACGYSDRSDLRQSRPLDRCKELPSHHAG